MVLSEPAVPDSKTANPKLVLCLMVANEEKIIERCLRSALPHVDAVVVCWNGMDATVDIARQEIKSWRAMGVDFHFEHHQWVNFGHNRTLSAKAAKAWVACAHPEWPLESTYLLFMDADMELVVEPGFRRSMLTAPGYKLIQLNHGEDYRNLRLARLSHDWRSVSVTHEYWAATPDIGEPATLDTRCDHRYALMWLMDHDDGGSKSDKTERDIRLLEQGLVDEPGNVRYMFYLARAYADSGQHSKAVPLYRQRQANGGWDQEVWYAHYREGLSLLALEKETEGIGVLLQAYQQRPTRAEPLAFLAQYHRERGRNHLALMFARQANEIPLSNDDLFVWGDAHYALPLREIAICAYYTGDREEGIAAAEILVGDRSVDQHTQGHMLQTLSFYVKPIAPQAVRMGAYAVPEKFLKSPEKFLGLAEPNTTEYVGKNPATVVYQGVTYTNISLVNYYHERGVVFAPKDADGIVRTRNVVLRQLVGSWNSWETTPAEWPAGWNPNVHIRGLEDQRWVVYEDRIWFTATCFHPHGRPEVVLGRLNDDATRVEFLTTLLYEEAGECEKNWVPFVDQGLLLLIYGFEPLRVLAADPTTGDCVVFSSVLGPVNASTWRGGTPPVCPPWGDDNCFVMLVHVVAHFDDRRVYMHRWVELSVEDDVFHISRWSGLFALDHVGVEYATGLLDEGETVLVAYGSEEREAKWIEFDWSTVNSMLKEK